jgi:hypothetical protein
MSIVLVKIGIWVWGSATLLLAAATFVFLIAASRHIKPSGANAAFDPKAPKWMPGVYLVLKDHNQLVAAILAVSGLAWSYFFQWKA